MYSAVIPVYKNEGSIPALLQELDRLNAMIGGSLEVVFVVDGSPDKSAELLEKLLPEKTFSSKLILLSRNFGSFAAIRAGLKEAAGPYFGVLAADLQEPIELIRDFFVALKNEPLDCVYGVRLSRPESWPSRWASNIFWYFYKTLIQKEIPKGGMDCFGCNITFRDHLLSLTESHSSLVGLFFWLGFRRKEIGYHRKVREHGRSAWTFAKKVKYLSDSMYSFSDLPVRLLMYAGFVGFFFSLGISLLVVIAKLNGNIPVPGYTATVLIISFFAELNCIGLGIIGAYVWRIFENTKYRPSAVIMQQKEFTRG